MPDFIYHNSGQTFRDARDQGFARGRENMLSGLYSQAMQAPEEQRAPLIAKMAAADPRFANAAQQQFQSQQDRQRTEAISLARAWKSSANAPLEQRQQFYNDFLLPRARQAGLPLPQAFDPQAFDREADALIAMGGADSGMAPRVVGDALVDSTGKVIYQSKPKNKYEFDSSRGAWVPHPDNVQQGQPNQVGQQDMQGDIAIANAMAQAGVEPEKIDAWIASRGQRAEQPQQQGGGLAAIPVAGLGPKPKDAPNGYRWNADGTALEIIPGGPAQVAADARDQAAAARKSADDAKALQAQQTRDARQVESAASANQLVTAIDSLEKHPGFASLGTALGDVQIAMPLMRNDAKDAHAQLKNIAGQVALATMDRLKALSAQGATGFGALSEKELELIKNSIATLQSDEISNKQLKDSLKIIRDAMEKVSNWQGGQQAAGGWSIQEVP